MNILAYVQLRNIYGSTGVGRVARQITEHLAQESKDHLHILADPLDYKKTVPKVGSPWTEFTYYFFKHETSRQQAQWLLTGAPQAEEYWPEAQIVYCPNESYVPTKKARLAVTLHDAAIYEKRALPRNRTFFKQRLKSRYLHTVLSRKADLFHTVSQFSAERIAHFFPSMKSRLCVVHHGVTPRFFLPPSAEGQNYLEETGLASRAFLLLPGGLNHRKNADLVLRAWPLVHQLHPELKLVVAGHCEPAYVIPAARLGESVKLLGFVSDEALCSLYHAAQIVWFPSLYEGFGLPVIEAMACGAPVVASDSTSIPEVAGGAAVLVSPVLPHKHVEAIHSLLEDSQLRAAFSGRGKARAGQFTWQRTAAELRNHFLSLV